MGCWDFLTREVKNEVVKVAAKLQVEDLSKRKPVYINDRQVSVRLEKNYKRKQE